MHDAFEIGRIIREEQHSAVAVPSTVFLRLRSVSEANLLAPILFKNLRPGSRIVSLNHHFEKYQASSALVFSQQQKRKEGNINIDGAGEFDELEEEDVDNGKKKFDKGNGDEEDMPNPKALFVYIVSHEQSSAIPHDIGRFSHFSIPLSHEKMIQSELSSNGGITDDAEMFHYRFLTSNRKMLKKGEKNNIDEDEDNDSDEQPFFHGAVSSHEIREDPNGKLDHCLITIGTRDLYLSFVRFQHPTLMNSNSSCTGHRHHQLDFEFKLIRGRRRRDDGKQNNNQNPQEEEDLTTWISNEGGKFEKFTIPRDELELKVPFQLSIEFRFAHNTSGAENNMNDGDGDDNMTSSTEADAGGDL